MENFAEIVDAADRLSTEDQIALVELLQHRVADQRRHELVAEVAEARSEYLSGEVKVATAGDLMDEIRDDS